jgi:ribosomal protein S18 acetylase RimI-like enzyme
MITVRKAEKRDIPHLIKMNDELNGVGSTPEWMEKVLEDGKEAVLVAEFDGAAIGFICGQVYKSICYADGCQCEVTELYVREGYRRIGAADRLIGMLEDEFRLRNGKEIILKTGADNYSAQRLYEKNGYEDYEEKVYFKEIGGC